MTEGSNIKAMMDPGDHSYQVNDFLSGKPNVQKGLEMQLQTNK